MESLHKSLSKTSSFIPVIQALHTAFDTGSAVFVGREGSGYVSEEAAQLSFAVTRCHNVGLLCSCRWDARALAIYKLMTSTFCASSLAVINYVRQGVVTPAGSLRDAQDKLEQVLRGATVV